MPFDLGDNAYSPVQSVFGRIGAVVAGNSDYLAVASGGLTGAVTATRYVGGTASAAPVSGIFAVGDFVIAATGTIWICTVAGTPGTWAQVIAGSAAAGSIDRTALSFAPVSRVYKAGTYVASEFGTIGSYTTAASRQWFTPFFADGSRTFDRIGIWLVTAGAANSVCRLGIYQDNAGVPGTLIADYGTVPTDGTPGAQYDISISWSPTAGLYWLSGCAQGGTPVITGGTAAIGMYRGDGQAGSAGLFVGGIAGGFSSNPAGTSAAIATVGRVTLRRV